MLEVLGGIPSMKTLATAQVDAEINFKMWSLWAPASHHRHLPSQASCWLLLSCMTRCQLRSLLLGSECELVIWPSSTGAEAWSFLPPPWFTPGLFCSLFSCFPFTASVWLYSHPAAMAAYFSHCYGPSVAPASDCLL